MLKDLYSYSTHRLVVREWHSFAPDEWNEQSLEAVVQGILTTPVTRSLPPAWQGTYTLDRARNWIRERDAEGVTLLVVEKASAMPVGLIVLFETACGAAGSELRLGYMLCESSWGRGLASELISGFVTWCENNHIASVVGGVEHDNIASRRVLEKSGFVCDPQTKNGPEQLFYLSVRHNK